MPPWNFVRDSLIVAAVVILLALAVALTLNLIRAYTPDGFDRAIPNPAVITVLYLLAFALLFVLWRSQRRPSRA
ncbi:MAG TPA: hypothetical protein VNP71_06165 [Thermoplasmata archaeon]|nr:hypothetical protein [Thermoplasmata archaeon]